MLHDLGNVVVLEEADGGDAGGSCCETGMGIRESDPAQGQHRDVCAAGFVQSVRPAGVRVFFFEDRGEDGEGGVVGCGLGYFCW